MTTTSKTDGATLRTRVAKRTADRFAALARRNGRSTAEELRLAVRTHLEENGAK